MLISDKENPQKTGSKKFEMLKSNIVIVNRLQNDANDATGLRVLRMLQKNSNENSTLFLNSKEMKTLEDVQGT